MVTYFLKVATIDEAREYISELEVEKLNEGDEAEVAFPDGSKQMFVFREDWESKDDDNYTITPGNS